MSDDIEATTPISKRRGDVQRAVTDEGYGLVTMVEVPAPIRSSSTSPAHDRLPDLAVPDCEGPTRGVHAAAWAPDDTYTHGHHETVLRSHPWRTIENSAAYLLPHLSPGLDVLDVGCGPGTITRRPRPAGRAGPVVGVDRSDDVLDRPAQAAARSLRFEAGDVYALDLPDDSFDVVHAHQVLQHLADPVAALREMRRVCRPGGVVAARDADYAAFAWSPLDDRLDAGWRVPGGGPGQRRRARRRAPLLRGRARRGSPPSRPGVRWCFSTARSAPGGAGRGRSASGLVGRRAGGRRRPLPRRTRCDGRRLHGLGAHHGWFAMLPGEILARPRLRARRGASPPAPLRQRLGGGAETPAPGRRCR